MGRCLNVVFAVGLTFAAATVFADDRVSPADRLKAAVAEFATADAAYRQGREKLADRAQDDPDVDRLGNVSLDKRRAACAVALEVAQADPRSDAGFEALTWLLLQAPWVYHQPAGVPALELMAKHHAAHPKVGPAIAPLAYRPPYGLPQGLVVEPDPAYRPAMDLLKAVADTNPDRAARGQAAMGLAWQAERAFLNATYKGNAAAARYKAEAEAALEAVVRDYDDCLYLGTNGGRPATSTLGTLARAELFQLRNLQPGNVAPDITGEDLDGAAFKLSDYRGRTVLLVFWGGWCGPCVADVPHERELVKRFAGRPFALVGVNSDDDKDKARRAVDKHGVNWRSFWNGPDGPRGPIAVAWNVRSWPTVYAIDHRGVIRHALLNGEELDGPLEKVVAEAEAAKVGDR